MDPRIEQHAAVIVEHSTAVEPDDNVRVVAPAVAEDLVVAIAERLGEKGANPAYHLRSQRASRAYMRAADADSFSLAEHRLAEMEETDVVIIVRGDVNANETSDVDPGTVAAASKAGKPIAEERMDKRWVGTQYPAPGNAQKAEMSTEAYADFVYDAVNKDWDAQREHQAQMVEILDPADEVRIVSGDIAEGTSADSQNSESSGYTTDVRMSVDGMVTANDYGELNLPGGEVYTAPRPESVEGEVLFDKPLLAQGREVEDARLVFEGGEVVAHSAAKNEDVLGAVLDTDDGARRLGELGIGMNRDIDRFTYNMLFDEKMGDTIHLAIGRAIEHTVPEGEPMNDSATHMDMIVDMSEDSYIEVDGEVVQRNGTFRFEDGFEGEA